MSVSKAPSPTVAILRRNPEACKAILLCGLLVVLQNVTSTLVVNSLQAEVWGERMAEYNSTVNLAMYTVAIFCTGPMGRLGDTYGNRTAVALVSLLASLPVLSLLVFGQGELGLTFWAVSRVLSGMGGASMSGSPAIYALVNELSAKSDMEVMLGLTFAGTALFWMAMNFVGVGIMVATGGGKALLYSMLVIVGLLFVTIAWIRSPEVVPVEDSDVEAGHSASEESAEVTVPAATGEAAASSCVLISSMKFAFQHRALMIMCFVAALVCIPENVLFDVQIQFAYSVLGLIGDSQEIEAPVQSKALQHERTKIAFATVVAIQFALMLGSWIVGQLSKKVRARKLLTWAIPVVAVMQIVPALSIFAKHTAMIVVCGAMLGFSLCLLPPLQAVTIHCAPAGRVSEAIGAMGAFKSLASLLGNLLVMLIVPQLQRTGLTHPLWVLYPACALVSMLGLMMLLRLPRAEGSAAEPDAKGADGSQTEMKEVDTSKGENLEGGTLCRSSTLESSTDADSSDADELYSEVSSAIVGPPTESSRAFSQI